MTQTSSSDALVFFGATGDLAHKKIFPALQKLAKRGKLEMPVIGVAKSGWSLQQLQDWAKDGVEPYGGLDSEGCSKLLSSPKLRQTLGSSQRPLHYLAIPPVLFPEVLKQLNAAGCAKAPRIVIEKPFGHDLASAHGLNEVVHDAFPEENVFRIDHLFETH